MTPEERAALINKLIDDVCESARGDYSYARDFIEDAMRHGYIPLSEISDECLLQWHVDSFDEDFLQEDSE